MLYKLNHKFFELSYLWTPKCVHTNQNGFSPVCFSYLRHLIPIFLSYYYPLQFAEEGNWGSERASDAQGPLSSQWRSWDVNPVKAHTSAHSLLSQDPSVQPKQEMPTFACSVYTAWSSATQSWGQGNKVPEWWTALAQCRCPLNNQNLSTATQDWKSNIQKLGL